jgi:thiol-disulfide isomerase/thioredoxin
MIMMGAILALFRRSGPIVVIVGAFVVLPFLVHKFFQPKLPVAMFDLDEVPRPLAEIEFQDETGTKYTLGQFHGNFALVNIWATWCPPCKEEMPSLNSLASHFSAKDLKIIPISVDVSGVPTARHFYTEFGLDKLSIYVDPSSNVMHAFSVVGIPTTLLINRDGLEIGRRIGPAQWDSPEIIEGLTRIIGSDANVTKNPGR